MQKLSEEMSELIFMGNGDLSEIKNRKTLPELTPTYDEFRFLLHRKKASLLQNKRLVLSRFSLCKITEGYNNCCSFCAIPLSRKSSSRSIEDIKAEIIDLLGIC